MNMSDRLNASGVATGTLSGLLSGSNILFVDSLANPDMLSVARPDLPADGLAKDLPEAAAGDASSNGPADTSPGADLAPALLAILQNGELPVLGGLLGADDGGASPSGPAFGLPVVTGLANEVIDDFHVLLEALSHPLGLGNTAHGVIETFGHQLGLGDIAEAGKHNVLTDVIDLPGQVTSGHALEGVSSILAGIGNVLGTAPSIAYGPTNDLGGGAGLIGAIGQLGNNTLGPVLTFANSTIDDVHMALEAVSKPLGLGATTHGLIHLGNTIGLGEIGEAGTTNLLTDALSLPCQITSGNLTGAVQTVVTDAGDIVGATSGIVGGLVHDINAGSGLVGQVGDLLAGGGLSGSGPTGGGLLGLPLPGGSGHDALAGLIHDVAAGAGPVAGLGHPDPIDIAGTHDGGLAVLAGLLDPLSHGNGASLHAPNLGLI